MTTDEVKAAKDKISKITATVEEYKKRIEKIKKDYVDKINGFIEELEYTINSVTTKSVQYIEMKTKKIMEKIDKALESLRKALEDVIKKISEWFEEQVNKVKESTVKSALAKVGMSVDDIPEMLLNMIPTPSMSISAPPIPTANDLLGSQIASAQSVAPKEYVKLPRLEI